MSQIFGVCKNEVVGFYIFEYYFVCLHPFADINKDGTKKYS